MKRNVFLCCMAVVLMALASCGNTEQPAAETKTPIAGASTAQDAGKQLFYAKCASCHMVNKELTGPALNGVESRWPDKEKLIAFIQNSEAVIATDAYARNLWMQFNQTPMPPHPDLTREQIQSILDYINAVSEKK
ncbi:MAG TPA: cytochrome c [Phnomibacter sp.]|nr:cytochrome c [Phnomibacter sp.]